DAPTIRPTRDLASAASPANAATPAKRDPAEDAPTLAPQSAIGSPVGGAAAANLSAREMRQAGGGFGYEPPEALVPRLSRPGLPSTSAAETVVGEDAGEETIDEPPPTPQGGDGQPTGRRLGSAASPNDEESAGDDADDDRFAPPAEHLEEHGRPDDQDVVIPPLREDLVRVLKLPLTKSGIGMLCVGTVMMSMFSVLPITPWTLIPALLMLSYPLTFLISCTRNGSLGREVLPDWPDFDVGLIGNGWRTLQVYVACALPGIVILLPLLCLASAVGKADKVPTELFSIGTEAHSSRRAEADWHVKKGTDVLGVKFLEPGTDAEIEIGAEWTVIGFLNRSNGDDTGTTETFTDIGAASAMGMAGVPAFQVHDLDRVGRSFRGKVKVLAAYADPDERIIQGRFGWLRPPEEEEEEEEDEEDEPDVDPEFQLNRKNPAVQDALNKVTKKMTFNKNYSDGIQVTRKFVGVEIVKTEGWAWPGPFEGIRPLPVVYVVDASGKIAKEYGAGVDDEQLYGDLQSLMDGGDGNTPGDSLPTDIKPSKGLIFALLKGRGLPILGLFVIPFVLFGFFYWPAAQLIMVSFDSGNMAFNYPATIRAIRVGFRDYLFLVGIIFGLSVAGGVLSGIIRMILFFAHDFIRAAVAGVFSSVFVFYSQIVGAYAIGRYYHANKESIGWFTK
ncbi:MAG: hypothetical protein JKY65_15605, partial [Planctomycetes bacterium]|nr:hypothetical protein [Planctomycetota bacterium]